MTVDPDDPLSALAPLERFHVRVATRMNREPWKAFWTACGRQINARWIWAIARRQTRVHGFEHVEGTSPLRPVLLVANHRSFFDMHLVTCLLLRRLRRRMRIYFPVRGRYYYETLGGMALNCFGAFWAMYPPLFTHATHQAFGRYSLEVLINLCRVGEGHFIGIHPEGGRNRDADPYSFRRIQPGTGRIIHGAAPQVIPIFIAGLGNSLRRHIAANWRGGEPIRVHFGPPVEITPFLSLPPKGSTYKTITEHAMSCVRDLAEQDRVLYASAAPSQPGVRDPTGS
jgi:1-acyl-sn-glycerol-3-phosphate acyltransferase